MIHDFQFIYGNNRKINDALGRTNGEMLLGNARRIFGGRDQVFFEYAIDEALPYTSDPIVSPSPEEDKIEFIQSDQSPSGVIVKCHVKDVIRKENDYTSRYDFDHNNGFLNPTIDEDLHTFQTRRYFGVDLEYILSISRAFTDYKFDGFDGEAKRILKAWIFVMTYGRRDPDEPGCIIVHSSKNEYGDEARPRAITRNIDYRNPDYRKQGSRYAQSFDDEWTLSADDYSRVAALDAVFTELVLSKELYNKGITADLIHHSRQYGDLVPQYLSDILTMQKKVSK